MGKNLFKPAIVLILLFACSYQSKSQNVPGGFQDSLVSTGWNQLEGFEFDATGQMYVWEKDGYVWVVDTNGVKITTPLLNIREEVGGWRDHGLNGFALDPNFRTNGYYYCMYTVDRHHLMNFGTGNYNASTDTYFQATIVRVTRYQASAATNFTTTVAGSRFVLIGETKKTGIPVTHESHTGGQMTFGTDGTLLIIVGDGASFLLADTGGMAHTYETQALNDTILRPKEAVGACRSQLLDCLNGKILRIDPVTGNGVPSNPYYDAVTPRSAKSRVWGLGFRNPFRMCKKPGTGSTDPTAGNPGSFYIGDVGWDTYEEMNVCNAPGQNFGWPNYEGLTPSAYNNLNKINIDAPNPLFGVGGCTRQYLYFHELIKQPTKNGVVSFPITTCNGNNGSVPAAVPHWVHARPIIDCRQTIVQARTGIWNGNIASEIDLGAVGCPITGPGFMGNAAVGGVWYTGDKYPVQYQNTYFHADFGQSWIKNFNFNSNDSATHVNYFSTNMGDIVFLTMNPRDEFIWYVEYPDQIRKIKYSLSVNNYPTAVATQNVIYGPTPFSVSFIGSQSSDPENLPLTYLWNFGDGSSTSSLQNPSHVFTALAGVPTTYTVTLTVTDNVGQLNSTTIKVYVNNTPPQIQITSPVNNSLYTMAQNTNVMCTANVTDAEHTPAQLTYQWQTILHHNTHIHPEAIDNNPVTSTTLTPEGCNGETFYFEEKLTVTDAAGLAATSSSFIYPACIAPVSAFTANTTTICTGATINFTDQSSSLPDNYSWTFTGGTPSTSTLKNPSVIYNTPGVYSVSLNVSNIWGGNTLTKTGYITVGSSPLVSVNATSTTICNGQSVTLTASGAQNYTWSPAAGLNTTTGATVIANPASTTTYTATGTNPGCAGSGQASITITVGALTAAVTPSGSVSICEGSAITLSASTGAGYTYQWRKNGVAQSGATNSTFATSSSGTYSCIITSGTCTGTSNNVVVNVINNPAPVISYTTPLTFCTPGSVLFTANTFAGVTYVWEKNSIVIAGANSQTYTATSNGKYRVKQTANGCTKSSVEINVAAASGVTSVITANGPTTFCSGGSVTLSLNSAIPGYSYQWKNNGVNISGATTANFIATSAGTYTCTVSASCGNATSNSIVVSTGGIMAIVTPSASVAICNGATVSLSANTGAGYNYQWKLNGTNISGATASAYNATAAGNYSVDITSPCGNATSPATTVVIVPLTSSITPSGTTTICNGNATTFSANTGYNLTYQWYRNGGSITGATNSTLATSNAGNYTVTITQGGVCSATSGQVVVAVTNNPNPTITAGGPTTFCAGQSVTLTANTFAGVIYQWQKGSTDIVGATAQNYIANSTGAYRVKETANGCAKVGTPVQVTVNCREPGTREEVEAKTEIKILPNPFSKSTTILIDQNVELINASLELFNVLGKKVKSLNIQQSPFTFMRDDLPSGIYLLRLKTNGAYKFTSRLVIE